MTRAKGKTDTMSATDSPTALFLDDAIGRSGKPQVQIAAEAGLRKPNVLSMMKLGRTKVPLERIPALAAATGVSARAFLRVAMAEYQPGVWNVLRGSFGDVLTEPEQDLLITFRLCDEEGEIRMRAEDVHALAETLGDLVERARDSWSRTSSGRSS